MTKHMIIAALPTLGTGALVLMTVCGWALLIYAWRKHSRSDDMLGTYIMASLLLVVSAMLWVLRAWQTLPDGAQ